MKRGKQRSCPHRGTFYEEEDFVPKFWKQSWIENMNGERGHIHSPPDRRNKSRYNGQSTLLTHDGARLHQGGELDQAQKYYG